MQFPSQSSCSFEYTTIIRKFICFHSISFCLFHLALYFSISSFFLFFFNFVPGNILVCKINVLLKFCFGFEKYRSFIAERKVHLTIRIDGKNREKLSRLGVFLEVFVGDLSDLFYACVLDLFKKVFWVVKGYGFYGVLF